MGSVLKRWGRENNEQYRLIVHADPKAVSSEAFRTLRTNLQFTSPDRELKSILITGPGPDAGKSTVAANLAIAWAQSGKRVVLVGADLRKPVLHQIFGIPNLPGLTGYLTDNIPLERIIAPGKIVAGLDLMPSGPIPPNPAELLQSQKMTDLLDQLREKYDYVLLDAAPVIAVTDAAVLAGKMDGTLLVISYGKVPHEIAVRAKTVLDNAQARLLGVVLNRAPLYQGQSHYYYYYQYGDAE